jgi:hypothetical protein
MTAIGLPDFLKEVSIGAQSGVDCQQLSLT